VIENGGMQKLRFRASAEENATNGIFRGPLMSRVANTATWTAISSRTPMIDYRKQPQTFRATGEDAHSKANRISTAIYPFFSIG
jgi:hypothetical protein